jgi:type IV pilus assembly protein PilQ
MAEAKPAMATAKPAMATAKPAMATAKPAMAEVKPAEAPAKPVVAEVKPAEAAAKPSAPEVKPSEAEVKPTLAEVQPIKAAPEPKVVPPEPKQVAAAPQPKPAAQARKALAMVKAVDLVSDEGEMKLVVALDGEAKFELQQNDATTATVTLRGATIPARLERNLDANALAGPVTMLSSYRAPGHYGEVKLVASLREPGSTHAAFEGGKLVWRFGAPAMAQAGSAAPRAAAAASESTSLTQTAVLDASNYTGRRVDFNVKDMDIRNLLGAIAEISKRNIILADDVTGRVTIKLRNVPWDQALDIILRAKALGREEVGNIIRVAPLATLRAEAKEAADAAKIERSLEPVKVRLIPVNYAKAGAMVEKLKDSLSERGTVAVDERTNTIIVKDVTDSLSRVEGIIKSLDTQTPEVLIEARIVEATTSFQRQIGVQWGGNISFAPGTGNPTGLVFPNILQIAGAADDPSAPTTGLGSNGSGATLTQPNFAVNMPAPIGLNNGAGLGFVFGSAGGAAQLNLRLSAAENSGTIKTISSPRIVTLDNVEANVGQGVQIPYSQVSAAGANTTFVEAKLELRVSPHVTQDGSIDMKISATNNAPNPALTGANGQPSISRRDARTEVLVRDGDTTVIGGIYTRRNSEAWNEVPFLSRIPILGWLFKKKAVTDDRTELLIFITPRIVNRSVSAVAAQSSDSTPEAQPQ